MRYIAIGTLGLGLWGCGDPLVDPQTVAGLRILGARVTVTSDQTRANVEAGEDADISWLVVAERTRSFRGLVLWCEAEPSAIGTPPCNTPFHELEFTSDSDAAQTFSFTLPNNLDDDEWVTWIGLCERGTPQWRAEAQRFECTQGEVVSAVYRGNTSGSNQNPSLQDDDLTLAGESWPALATNVTPTCDGEGVPRVASSERTPIRLRAKGNDREELEGERYAAATRETLTYTHVATWPSLERAYSALEGDSKQFEVDYANDGPTPRPGGELVRFALVVRDGRGGTDWVERWFCLTP